MGKALKSKCSSQERLQKLNASYQVTRLNQSVLDESVLKNQSALYFSA